MCPLKSQGEFETTLCLFCKKNDVPVDLIMDGLSAQKKPCVKRFCNQVGTALNILECATLWANISELCIGLLKEVVRKDI